MTQGAVGFIQMTEALQPLVTHSVLLIYVEAYTVVADLLARMDYTESLDEKTAVATALKYGKQAYLQRRISSEASIGKILFKNGYQLFSHRNLTQAGDVQLSDERKAAAREFHDLARQIKRLTAIAEASRGI